MTTERLIWTFVPVLLGIALQNTPLLGVDHEVAEDLLKGSYSTTFSVGALGLTPLLSAFALVELGAAIVPKWRHLRVSPAGQMKLHRHSIRLALLFATLQAYWVVQMMNVDFSRGMLLATSKWLPMGVLVLGTVSISLLAHLINHRGLGSGFLLMLVGLQVGEAMVPLLLGKTFNWLGLSTMTLSKVAPSTVAAAILLVVAASTYLISREQRVVDAHQTHHRLALPLLLSGALPLYFGLSWVPAMFSIEWLSLDPTLRLAVSIGVILVATVLGSYLLNQPDSVRKSWRALALPTDGEPDWRGRPVPVTLAFIAVCLLAELTLSYVPWNMPTVFSIVLLTSIALELRARVIDPPGLEQTVWLEQRVHVVPMIAERLRRDGVDFRIEGYAPRLIMPFFALFQPIKFYTSKEAGPAAHNTIRDAFLED